MDSRPNDVKKLLQELVTRPRALINDKTLQDQLLALNNEVDHILKKSEETIEAYREMEAKFSTISTSPDKMYNSRRNVDQKLLDIQGKLQCAGYISDLLWDTYDEMIKAKVAMLSKKEHFQSKSSENGRSFDKISTKVYITSELRSIANVIAEIRTQKYSPWARKERDTLNEHMDRLEQQMNLLVLREGDESRMEHRSADDKGEMTILTKQMEKLTKRSKDISSGIKEFDSTMATWQTNMSEQFETLTTNVENFQNKMEQKIEESLKAMSQQMLEKIEENTKEMRSLLEKKQRTPPLEDILTLLEDDEEVAMMLTAPPLEDEPRKSHSPKEPRQGIEDASAHSRKSRKEREYQPDEVTTRHPVKLARRQRRNTPLAVSEARSRLKGLREFQPRKIEDAKITLLTTGARLVICDFCRKRGKHSSDACTTFPSVKERRALIRDERMCRLCLKIGCDERCKTSIRCGYCGDKTHHEALCALPDDRQEQIAILDAHDNRRWRECAERLPHH